jgi:hypothetical protein
MSARVHIFVTQRVRDEAVDRIMATLLEAHQLRPVDRHEQKRGFSLSPAALPLPVRIAEPSGPLEGHASTQRPKWHGLLLGERLLLVCVAALTVLVVAGNLLR